ncbi:hypothetical protein PMAYCL1PPCAC_23409, partial [Pristionchus mayeri]
NENNLRSGTNTFKPNSQRPLLKTNEPEFPNEKQLEKFTEFVELVKATGVQGLIDEFAAIKGYNIEPFVTNAHNAHQPKNRYKDIYCLDESRVVLSQREYMRDYIHANFVKGPPFINDFICTQGPLMETIVDFWRMAWQENAGYIVMLCELVELGKKKCERYIPSGIG